MAKGSCAGQAIPSLDAPGPAVNDAAGAGLSRVPGADEERSANWGGVYLGESVKVLPDLRSAR